MENKRVAWNKGIKLSEEHCKNLSLSHKGKVSTFKGKHHTEETKEILRQYRFKQVIPPHSEETRKKISASKIGRKNPAWKGGRKILRSGYIMVLKKGYPGANKQGYILEHRHIMSVNLGRPLLRNEIVHHLNEIKTDNRIENLKLVTSPKEHWTYHRKHIKCTLCDNPHQAKGYCKKHYMKIFRPNR